MAYTDYENPFAGDSELASLYNEERKKAEAENLLSGSIRSGVLGLGGSVNSALAAGGRILGADGFAEGREAAADQMSAQAAGAGYKTPHFQEIGGVGDALGWGIGMVGSNLPLLGTMALTGAAGGIGGSAVIGRAKAAKAVGDIAAKQSAARLTALGATPAEVAAASASAAAQAAGRINAKSKLGAAVSQGLAGTNKGAAIGRHVGAAVPYIATTTGENYNVLRNDPDAEGTAAEQAKGALAAGAVQTALGTMFEPLGVTQKILARSKAARQAAASGAKIPGLTAGQTWALASAGEGVTEAGEQLVQQYMHNQYNEDAGYDKMQLLESALGGAVVGGAYAAPSGLYSMAMQKRHERLQKEERERGPTNPVDINERLRNLESIPADKRTQKDNKEEATLRSRQTLALLNANAQGISNVDALDNMGAKMDQRFREMMGSQPEAGDAVEQQAWSEAITTLSEARNAISEHKRALAQQSDPTVVPPADPTADQNNFVPSTNPYDVPSGLPTQTQLQTDPHNVGTPTESILDGAGTDITPTQTWIDPATGVPSATPPQEPVNNDAVVDQEQFENLSNISHGLATAVNDLNRTKTDTSLVSDQAARRAPDTVRLPTKEEEAQLQAQQAAADLAQQAEIQQNDPSASVTEMEVEPETGLQKDPEDVTNQEPNADPLGDPTDAELIDLLRQRDAQAQVQQGAGFDAAPSNREYSEDEYRAMDAVLRGYAPKGTTALTEEVYDNLKRTYEEEQATQQETNQDNAGERTNPFDAIIRKVQERGTGAISDPDVSSIEAGADVLRAREAVRRGYAPVGTEAVTEEVYNNLKEAHIERLKQQAAGRNANEINTIDDVRNDTFDPILRKLQERGTGEVADPTSYDLRGGVDPQTLSSGQPASVIHNSRVDPLETFIDRDVSETAGYHSSPPSDPIELVDDSVVTPIADRIQPDKYLTDLGVVDDYNSTEGLNSQLSVTQAYTNPQTGERVARTIIDRGLINAIFQPPGNTAIQKRAIDEMAARYSGDTPFYVYRKLNKIDSKDNQARAEIMQSFEFGRRLSAHKVLGPVSEKLGIDLTELAVEYLDGVAPANRVEKAHELLSLLLSTQDEVTNTAVKDLNASETQVMGQRMYALVNAIPPDMLEVVGLSPHKTDTETSIPIGEIADLGDRYTVTRSNNGLYTTITDITGNALGRGRGSTLELPTDFLTGRLYNLPIILNGQEIQKNEVRDVMTESLRNGTPPKAERLLAAAKKSAEWRTNPLERTIVTGYFDGTRVSHRVEPDVIDSRPRPISDEFNIRTGKVKGLQPEEGMGLLINDMARKGLVMVGKMDNSLYFATPEDSMRLFHKLGIAQKVVDNRHMIERVGVLLKKQSGNQSEISLANWINGTADFHTDKTHDGVMVIGKGVRTSQGVLMHTQLDQFGNETYAFDKGMARSPLQVRDWSVSADGTLRLGDVQQEEGESLNKSLQLTQELDPNNLSPTARMFSMFPPAIQRSNRANMQQMLFSVAKPLEFLRKDRKERFHEANVFELMADYQKQLAQKGIPISKIVTANSFAKKMTELIVSSTRGYTFSSEHVNEGEFMLLPEAYQQMNREYMEAHNGQTLQPGTEVLIHRDPSLSDGSSMHTYKFSGIMTLQTADVQHGMIVNPKDPLWKASAGDFDGDAGVAILKQEFFDEIDTYRTPALDDISFVDKGGTAHSGADALLNRELITNYPSVEDRSRLIAADQLNAELLDKASFFDTKIGSLMAMAQRARELGIDKLPVTVVYPKRVGDRVIYKVATVQLRGLLAKLGQASISSKKHPVWIDQAELIMLEIRLNIMGVPGDSINTLLGAGVLRRDDTDMSAEELLRLREEIIKQAENNPSPDTTNSRQGSQTPNATFTKRDVVPREVSPGGTHTDLLWDSNLKTLIRAPRRSFSSMMRNFMKAPSREKSEELTDLLNNSTITLHEALIAHLRNGDITTDSDKFKAYEEEMLQKVIQAGNDFKMKDLQADNAIARNLLSSQEAALNAKLRELANSPDRRTRFYNMLDAAWMLARWTKPNVEATMDSQHLYDMISEAEETNPVMGDADLHTELALRAYAVGNSIIKNGVFTTDQSLSPVLRAGAQSIIQHSDRGSRGLELASHFRNRYDDIQANHQELDQTEEPEKYQTYQNKISDLKSEINFLVTRGDISVAELVNNGPLQLIDSLVTGEQLQPLLDAARADVSIPVPMSVTGVNQHGQEMDASAIPHGVYKREINPDGTISYKHVTGAQKNAEGKQELVFSGVVIQRATKLEDMAHSTEAHVNSEEYIKTRASSSQNLLFVSSQKTSSATEQKQLDFAAIDMGEFYAMLGDRKDSPDSATMFGVAAENTTKGEVQKITGRKIDGGDFIRAIKANPGEQVTGDINVFQAGKREGQGMGADELYGNPQRKRTSVLKIYKPNKIITFRGDYTVYNPVTRTREKVTEIFVKLTDVKIEAEVNGTIQNYSGAEFLQKFENTKNRPAGTAIKKITLTGVKVENPQDTSAGGFKDTESMRDKLQYKRDLGGKTNSFVTQNLDLSSKEEAAAAMGLRKAGTVTFTDKHLDSIPAVGETTYLVHHYTDKNGVYVRIPYKATVASKTPSAEDASKGTVEYYIEPKQKPKPERLVPPDMASVGATNEDVNNAREPFMHPDGRMLYLSDDQTKALRATLPLRGQGMQNQTIVVKGAAGTGKSTFTRELMRRWRYMYGPGGVVTAAPTHRAGDVIRQISTRKINGEIVEETPKTIASLLGQRFDEKTGEMMRRDLPGKIPENGPPISKLGAGDVLIIDEASMISKEDYLDIKHWQDLIGFNMIIMGDTEQIAPFGSSTTSVALTGNKTETVARPAAEAVAEPTEEPSEDRYFELFAPIVEMLTGTKVTDERQLWDNKTYDYVDRIEKIVNDVAEGYPPEGLSPEVRAQIDLYIAYGNKKAAEREIRVEKSKIAQLEQRYSFELPTTVDGIYDLAERIIDAEERIKVTALPPREREIIQEFLDRADPAIRAARLKIDGYVEKFAALSDKRNRTKRRGDRSFFGANPVNAQSVHRDIREQILRSSSAELLDFIQKQRSRADLAESRAETSHLAGIMRDEAAEAQRRYDFLNMPREKRIQFLQSAIKNATRPWHDTSPIEAELRSYGVEPEIPEIPKASSKQGSKSSTTGTANTASVPMADEHSNTVELLEVQRQKGSNSLLTVLTDMRGERDIKKIRNAIRNADVNLQTGEGIITVKDHQELKDVLEALGINARRMAANPNLLANMSYTNNGTSKLKTEIHQMLYPERYDNVEDPQSIVQLAEGEHLTGYRRSMAINDDNTQAKAVENGINYTVETIGPVKQRIIGKSVGGTPLVVDGSDVTFTDGTTSRTVFVVTPKSHYVYSNAVKAAQAQYEYLLRFKDAGTASQYLNYTLKPLQNAIASTQDVITLEDGKRKTLLARLFDSASVSTVTKMQGGTVNVATFEIDSADAAIIEDVNNPMSEEEKTDTVRHIIYTALSRASKLAIVIDPSIPASAERLNKAMLIEQNVRNSNPANTEAWFEKKEEAIPTEDASKYGVSAREEAQNVPFEGSVEAVTYTDPADNMQSKSDSAGKASTTEKGVPVGQGDKAPEAEILQKLSEKYAFDENGQSAVKDNLQNAIDSLRALLDIKAPVELVTAEQMHALLVREGGKENLEAAAKIIQHGRGEVGGFDGFHYIRPDGTRFIYVTAKKGDLRQAQLLITLHELGHTVIESHWEEMAKTDPNLATSIITDMIKVLKKRGEKKISPEFRKALNAIGGGKTANQIIHEINMNSDPAIKAEFHRYFNEWLADNIAKWMVTSDEARSATNNWFKSIATRIKNSFKAVLDYLKNIAGIDSTQVPGVKQWMENLVVRNQEAVTRIYGQRNNFTSIADVMYQRRAALRAWAETGMPNMTALNEMVPEIFHNLDGLIPSQDANVLRRIAMENNMRHRMLMLIGKDTQAAEAINKSADHAVAYMYALTTLGIMRQTGTAEALTTKLRESILENMRGAMEATDAEINDIVGNLNKPVLERTGSTLIPENSMAARLYKKRNERHQQGVAGMFTKMNNKYNEYFDWYLTDAPTRILRTGVPALREFVNAINATASELGGLQRAGTYELTLTNYNTFSHRGAEILSKLTEDQKQEVREVLFKHPQNFKKSGPATTAVKDLRNLLERLYEYQSVAGTDVKHRKDYFPMILNNEYIKENIQEVVALYTSTDKLKKEWEGVRGEYVEWLNKAFKNGGITSPNDLATAVAEIQKMTIPEFTEFYLKKSDEHMLPNWQLHGLEDNKVHTPGFRFSNPRLLDFLLETGDKNLHEKIVNTLENDIGQVLERYIRASAKRAQHEHLMSQFGGNGLQHLWDKARAQGATEADIKLAVKYMDALQGMLGIEERDAIDKLIDKTDENSMWQKLRSDKTSIVSENVQKIISWVLTYMNISHLTLSAFAAAIDPFGQLMRHGSGKIFADSISETYIAMRNAAKNMPRDELSRFIDFTGVTEAQMSRADMRNTYSAGVETKTTHKINEAFFKYNGTAGLTEFSRMLAGRAAFKSIAMWKKNAESGNGPEAEKAWNELRSLGIMPEEIELSKEGNPIVLTWEEREALHGAKNDPNSPVEVKQQAEQKIKNDDAVRTAVFRFVDQSNVRPNPTSRQLIGSNPYYAIMMQWKTFSTTWDANIWRPMVAKLVERGELTPAIMSVGVLLPVMLFADIIRDAVTTAFDDDDDLFSRPGYKTNWTLLDHVEHAAKRTGFYGKHELMADIVEPMSKGQYDKALAEVGGVAASDTNKVLKYGMSSMPYPGGNVLKPWGRDLENNEPDVSERSFRL